MSETKKVSSHSLSKQQLLELAGYLYSRYENKYRETRRLQKKYGRAIIQMDSNHDRFNS